MLTPLCFLLLHLVSAAPSHETSLEVQLTSGNFRGTATTNGTNRWLGIPFAQPPVGSLRFRAPLPITNATSEIKDASAFGNACPQVPSSSLGAPISEDCLFLNVCICFRLVRDRLKCPSFTRCGALQMYRLMSSCQYLSGSM